MPRVGQHFATETPDAYLPMVIGAPPMAPAYSTSCSGTHGETAAARCTTLESRRRRTAMTWEPVCRVIKFTQ